MRTRKLIKKFYINLHDPDVHVHRYLDMFKHNVAMIIAIVENEKLKIQQVISFWLGYFHPCG
jgi:hypothetical protein